MNLDRDSHVALYVQLADLLRNQILSGVISSSEKLPAELSLANEYGLSRGTVRRALELLEGEGLLIRKPGKGTFVKAPSSVRQDLDFLDSLYNTLLSQGVSPIVDIVDFQFQNPPENVIDRLELAHEDSEALRIIRKYSLADQEPIALAFTYIPYQYGRLFSREDVERFQVYELLESKCQTKLAFGRRIIAARAADPRVAGLLGIEPNVAVLVAELLTFSTDKTPVQLTVMFYRSDRFAFSIDLPWTGSVEAPALVWAGDAQKIASHPR